MFAGQQQAITFIVQTSQTAVGDINQLEHNILAPGLQVVADFCRSITKLVGFNECRANVSITMLGNPEAVIFTARGVLPDVHTDPGHQLSWVGKSLDINNFCNHSQCKDILDFLVTGQQSTFHCFSGKMPTGLSIGERQIYSPDLTE